MNNDIDAKPPPLPMLLYGLQWWAVATPSVIILGLVAAKFLHPADAAGQSLVLQKLFCLTGLAMAAQILVGHKLPIVTGPASVLLIGMIASQGATPDAVHTAVAIGGVAMVLLAASGALRRLQVVFTPRVLVVIMLLIPFTLTPSILGLVFQEPERHVFHLLFVCGCMVFLLACNKILSGVWKSVTLLIVMLAGSAAYFAVYGLPELAAGGGTGGSLFTGVEFDAGVVLSFLFCAMALTFNEVSSVQGVGRVLDADALPERGKRGVIVTGVANVASGALGVMGCVDYTTSAGIIQSTGCGSRFPFLPAAALLVLSSLSPALMAALLAIPAPLLGLILFYVMAAQFSAGLQMIARDRLASTFDEGLVLAIPLLIAVLAAFVPHSVTAQIPALVRPIFGNAFVLGVLAAIAMEQFNS